MNPDREARELSMLVPGFDLSRQNTALKEELQSVIEDVIDGGRFILGENVALLEREIAAICGVDFGIGVANGSDALHLALSACGVGTGDEVITTPFTFFATAGAIVRTGARPVFCDIDPATYNIDPLRVASCITKRTKAIIPVHLYGQPADVGPIIEVARERGLFIIEDAAQALGAQYKGRPIGSLGDIACISFFPTKNLGAFGDAGMVVTNNPALAEQVRVRRVHGGKKKYYHEIFGYNSRLDELQAAVLRLKLRYFPLWTSRRREIAAKYRDLLGGTAGVISKRIHLPVEKPGHEHVYHQFTIAARERDRLQRHLAARNIGSTVYYPLPLHLQPVFSDLGYRQGDFSVAESAAGEVLSLPMFPELTDEEIHLVAQAICEF